eukprot:COSAG06_NODE_3425_length_5365_cov_4.474744_2_plen_36_part_00
MRPAVGLLASVLAAASAGAAVPSSRPHLVFVMADE